VAPNGAGDLAPAASPTRAAVDGAAGGLATACATALAVGPSEASRGVLSTGSALATSAPVAGRCWARAGSIDSAARNARRTAWWYAEVSSSPRCTRRVALPPGMKRATRSVATANVRAMADGRGVAAFRGGLAAGPRCSAAAGSLTSIFPGRGRRRGSRHALYMFVAVVLAAPPVSWRSRPASVGGRSRAADVPERSLLSSSAGGR